MDPGSKANITDSQTATFDFAGLRAVWTQRSWGSPPDPKYPWGATIYGDKGTLKASVMSYDFVPRGGGPAVHKDVTYELEQYPIDNVAKDLEQHVASAIRAHNEGLPARHREAQQARCGHRAGPHLERLVHLANSRCSSAGR